MYPPVEFQRSGNIGDTTLRLDGFGYGMRETDPFGNSQTNGCGQGKCMDATDDGCKLVLGLGPSATAYIDKYPLSGADKSQQMTRVTDQGLASQRDSVLQLGLSGGSFVVSNALDFSASVHGPIGAPYPPGHPSSDGDQIAIPVVDEGSTSAKKSGGYMKGLILAPALQSANISFANNFTVTDPKSHCQIFQLSPEPSAVSSYSISAMSESGSAAVSSDQNCRNSKRCKFPGCVNGARGATGLCISHGGGQRCQRPGCSKGAESRSVYCKSHGGGRRCQHLGCTKSAEGKTDHCIAHGGGKRCEHPGGCSKAARGKSGLCIRHGGGKRCKVEGCSRSAEGQIGLCISHGGGRRCQFIGCNKGAQGSTMFCKGHGGGKRCVFAGCSKGAEGSTPLCKGHGGGKRCLFDGGGICPKSVHGGTSFCVAHGGGKRCIVPGCSKSARGRTDSCVRHGGGKRCKVENCGKSAQGSTDLCKAHGGGKRCSWAEGKCEKFSRGRSGLCAAHTSLVQGQESDRSGMIGPGLFHGLVPAGKNSSSSSYSYDNTCSSSGVSAISEWSEEPAKRQQLIPPQVLVPLCMKSSSSVEMAVPEGRVHGGALMSLLGGNLNNSFNGM